MIRTMVAKRYSPGEEIASSITHGIGTCLSVAGLVLLIKRVLYFGPPEYKSSYIAGVVIFGVSLIILYTASTYSVFLITVRYIY